ncbi:MAG: C45 family autoproteolytic acyltransferase/hydrolase [Actinomycetota bacterium]
MSFTVAHVSGDHRKMGRAYGEICAPSIQRSVDFYESLTRRHRTSIAGSASRLGPHIDAARRRLPELVEELEGLAEGAGIDGEAAWMLNSFEELWDVEACTTMAHGHLFMHAEQWYAEHSDIALVVAVPDIGPSFLSPTCAGFLPAVGLNVSGFAQGIDSLVATDDRPGVPRCLVARHALGAAGMDAALRATVVDERAGGYAHFFSSVPRTVVVETSATSSEVLEAQAHTNHHQARWLQHGANAPSPGSLERLVRACELLAEWPPTSLEDCARLLSDHRGEPEAICMHERGFEGSGTVFGFACDLRTGRCMISDGPPCEGRWHELELPGYVPQDHRHVG